MALVHSYARFSDPSQAAGDSLRRQREGAEKWCRKNGHQLSDLTFRDLGKSGWKPGRQKALDAFLRAIKSGQVKAGEILLVEAVDRLSRKGVWPTQSLVSEILNAGVAIAILTPMEKVYSAENHNDVGGAIELAAFAYQASIYSENLSRRVKESVSTHQRKFHAGERKRWSPIGPAWLEWDQEAENWVERPEVVEAIRYAFKRTVEGIGRRRLCQELNAKFDAPGKRKSSHAWNDVYLGRLVKTRTVLGELESSSTGETLTGYYPAIIDEETWKAANVAAANRRGVKGPQEQHANIFSGILFAARDGSAMGYYSISHSAPRKRTGKRNIVRRYRSKAATDGIPGADKCTIDVPRFEDLVLSLLPKLELSDGTPELKSLENERQYLQQEIDSLQSQIRTRAKSAAVLGPVLGDLSQQLDAVELRVREAGTASVVPTLDYRRKLSAMQRGTQAERERVRDALRAIVRRIEVVSVKEGPARWDRIRCLVEIEFRDGQFARGLELPDRSVAVVKGPALHKRLSEQLAGGWSFGIEEYEKAVKVASKAQKA